MFAYLGWRDASRTISQSSRGARARTWRRPVTVSIATTALRPPLELSLSCINAFDSSSGNGSSIERLSLKCISFDCPSIALELYETRVRGRPPSESIAYHSPVPNGTA